MSDHYYSTEQRIIPVSKFNLGAVLAEVGDQFSDEQKQRILTNLGVHPMTNNWDEFCGIMKNKDEIVAATSAAADAAAENAAEAAASARKVAAETEPNDYESEICKFFDQVSLSKSKKSKANKARAAAAAANAATAAANRLRKKARSNAALADDYNEIVCAAFANSDGCINVAHFLSVVIT